MFTENMGLSVCHNHGDVSVGQDVGHSKEDNS